MSWPLAGTTSVGREGDIAIDDPFLSRRQATLRWRGGRVRVRPDGGTNPTVMTAGPLRARIPSRWMTLPPGARLRLGSGTFAVLARRRPRGLEREGGPGGAVGRFLPLSLVLALPLVLGGSPWRWLVMLVPAVAAVALLRGTARTVRGPRRGERPHEISLACREGHTSYSEPALPRRPRLLRRRELAGTGWCVRSEEEACWLAGYLAAYNDPEVLVVSSPWLTTTGRGLTVRFVPDARSGPAYGEAVVTWAETEAWVPPGWAVPLRVPARASPVWARSLGRETSARGIPETVRTCPNSFGSRSLARAWEAPVANLAVELGLGTDGPVVVDLAAHGPHALVAGTTGAGKSELLTTWVLGLAAQSSPASLALVLVDFKGGAAFGSLANLPHCAAVLTDLDPAATRRALASIRALLRQRERLLYEAGCRDVTEMDAVQPGAVPRLLLVVDEFRALADDHPDLLEQLLRLGAQGRSLGVHLIVATQRPAGAVVPELRANMALRVCLRVAEAGDSHDVLGVPDAASLPRVPGRALLGAEGTREFQVAWSGDAAEVRSAVRAIQRAWTGGATAAPWCPPLPRIVELETLPPDALALADEPDELSQQPLVLAPGNILIAGPPRSGRSAAARAVVTAALAQGDEAWLVTADRDADAGAGCVIHAAQTRLIALALTHCADRARRTLVVDDAEMWLAAHDDLHGPGAGAGLLTQSLRTIAAAGSRIVIVGSGDLLTARWASAISRRYLLGGTDTATALLAGVSRAAIANLQQAIPGRGLCLTTSLEIQFGWTPHVPRTVGRTRSFTPLPPSAVQKRRPDEIVLGTGGDPLRQVALPVATDLVVVGLGRERDAATALVASQRREGAVIAVTPGGWATGWSGELGRIRETAAVLVVRPDLVGAPSGLSLEGSLEPGSAGYAVLVQGGVAVPLRLASSVVEDVGAVVHDVRARGRGEEQDERRPRGDRPQHTPDSEGPDEADERQKRDDVPGRENSSGPRPRPCQLPRGGKDDGTGDDPENEDSG
ncbi:MAG TPA: FtsK/SpoIIIE domain-containing protein [Actinomycetaceae bacterium]|nr:FtsK/SpoIIIE domain-containing protein [Actinomycetaceae bacterium]